MHNPAELRRFPSPHPSLFFGFLVEFLGSNEEGMGVEFLYRGRSPGRPGGGGDRPPCIFFGQGPRCKFEEKNYN